MVHIIIIPPYAKIFPERSRLVVHFIGSLVRKADQASDPTCLLMTLNAMPQSAKVPRSDIHLSHSSETLDNELVSSLGTSVRSIPEGNRRYANQFF